VSGDVPETAQLGVKDTLRAQGYFLACQLRPQNDLSVASGSDQRVEARITGLDSLSGTVMRVRLQTAEAMPYFPGQFVSVFREDGLARSYSLASLPIENHIELHVRRVPNGAMSGWLHETARVSNRLWLQGPSGNCFYTPGSPDQPMVLAGAGTGLAPLYGIARDALYQGHTGDIWLFHGALTPAGLYLTRELSELQQDFPQFHYVKSVLQDDESSGAHVGPLDQCILATLKNLAGWKAYVCGDPAIVSLLRKKLFLAGVASKAIYADSFIPSASS
jgi:NAD(P)H-flavin reductase